MRYAIPVLAFLCCSCLYLAYRLGDNHCRTSQQRETLEQIQNSQIHHQQIEQMVLSIPDSVNLEWLCQNYLRAD